MHARRLCRNLVTHGLHVLDEKLDVFVPFLGGDENRIAGGNHDHVVQARDGDNGPIAADVAIR
jgi:hypothetical protein